MKNTRLFVFTALAAVLFLSFSSPAFAETVVPPANTLKGSLPTVSPNGPTLNDSKWKENPETSTLTKERDDALAQVASLQQQLAAVQQAYQSVRQQRVELATQVLDLQLQVNTDIQAIAKLREQLKAAMKPVEPPKP